MRYVALLRGINVGGNAKISMPRLKSCFELCGFGDVKTYINSGNVLFSSDETSILALRKAIERAIEHEFGLSVLTHVVSLETLLNIERAIDPTWRNDSEQKTDIIFLFDDSIENKVTEAMNINPNVDELRYVSGAVIWHIDRKNYTESGMKDFIKNPNYKQSTIRNCNTVSKLLRLTSS